MLGICNGFQVLCEAGLLPGALVRNRDLAPEWTESVGMGIWRIFSSRPEEITRTDLIYGGTCYIAGFCPTGEDSMYAYLVEDAKPHDAVPQDQVIEHVRERSRLVSRSKRLTARVVRQPLHGTAVTRIADVPRGRRYVLAVTRHYRQAGHHTDQPDQRKHLANLAWQRGRLLQEGDGRGCRDRQREDACANAVSRGQVQAPALFPGMLAGGLDPDDIGFEPHLQSRGERARQAVHTFRQCEAELVFAKRLGPAGGALALDGQGPRLRPRHAGDPIDHRLEFR